MIAAVEEARAKQEREADRLRDKLSGFGKTLSPLASRTNGAAATTANGGSATGGFSGANEGEREDLVDSAEVRTFPCGSARSVLFWIVLEDQPKSTLLVLALFRCGAGLPWAGYGSRSAAAGRIIPVKLGCFGARAGISQSYLALVARTGGVEQSNSSQFHAKHPTKFRFPYKYCSTWNWCRSMKISYSCSRSRTWCEKSFSAPCR